MPALLRQFNRFITLLLAFALVTKAFYAQALACDNEFFLYFVGNADLIQGVIKNIRDGIAGQAEKVVMGRLIHLKAPGRPLPLCNINQIDFDKGHQGPVHRVQGNIGKSLFYIFVDHIGSRVAFGFFQRCIHRNPLRGDF